MRQTRSCNALSKSLTGCLLLMCLYFVHTLLTIHYATAADYTFYLKSLRIKVRTHPDFEEGYAAVSWQYKERRLYQKFALPQGWWPPTREYLSGRRTVLVWNPRPSINIVVLILENDYALSWDWRKLALYQLQGNSWQLINSPGSGEFSNAGSFFLEGKNLYMWDIEYDARYSHSHPQKYRLQHYAWRNKQFSLRSQKITKKRYKGSMNNEEPGSTIKEADDPLREFGMKWRWWA